LRLSRVDDVMLGVVVAAASMLQNKESQLL